MKHSTKFTPPPLAKLAPLLLLAVLAWPAQAQQQPPLAPLVIPAVNGPEACTDGGLSELRDSIFNVPNDVRNSLTINITPFNATGFTSFFSIAVPSEGIPLSVGVMKNEVGGSAVADTQSLGTLRSDSPIASQSVTFSSLDKSTRYVVGFMTGGSFISRRCFKTRGEFTNAEQNLVYDGTNWGPNLAQYNRTGCYAVASTRQDIRDCYCNGTRGGTHILAGQTVASQAQRQYLNCPDLDS